MDKTKRFYPGLLLILCVFSSPLNAEESTSFSETVISSLKGVPDSFDSPELNVSKIYRIEEEKDKPDSVVVGEPSKDLRGSGFQTDFSIGLEEDCTCEIEECVEGTDCCEVSHECTEDLCTIQESCCCCYAEEEEEFIPAGGFPGGPRGFGIFSGGGGGGSGIGIAATGGRGIVVEDDADDNGDNGNGSNGSNGNGTTTSNGGNGGKGNGVEIPEPSTILILGGMSLAAALKAHKRNKR